MTHCEACYDLGAECECDRHSKTPSTTSKPVEELKVIEYPDGFRFGNGDDIIVSSEILHEYIQKQVLEGQIKILAHILVHQATGRKHIGLSRGGVVSVLAELQHKRKMLWDALQTNNKEEEV